MSAEDYNKRLSPAVPIYLSFRTTNESLERQICGQIDQGQDQIVVALSRTVHPRSPLFEVPLCLSSSSVGYLYLSNALISNFSVFPTTLRMLEVQNSHFASPLDWNALYARLPELTTISFFKVSGIGSIPPYQPRNLTTFIVEHCNLTGVIAPDFYREFKIPSIDQFPISSPALHTSFSNNRISGTLPPTLFEPFILPNDTAPEEPNAPSSSPASTLLTSDSLWNRTR